METMQERVYIDFDVRADTPAGKDPDSYSPTLRRYHQILWSKPLPSGDPFTLNTTRRHAYLHHQSPLGEFFLSSDRIAQGLSWSPEGSSDYFGPDQDAAYQALANSVAGVMTWPGNKIDRKMTVNGASGV